MEDIYGGGYFSMALDNRGRLYAWGDNRLNKCFGEKGGKGGVDKIYEPLWVLSKEKITQISVSWHHSMIVTEKEGLIVRGGYYVLSGDPSGVVEIGKGQNDKYFDSSEEGMRKLIGKRDFQVKVASHGSYLVVL